jgi:hypothetical protein
LIEQFKQEYAERTEQKRRELVGALKRGEVGDPFSASFLVSIAISAAISVGTAAIASIFAPKPPTIRKGERTGELVLRDETRQPRD